MLEKLPDVVGHALRGQRAGLDKIAYQAVDLRAGMASLAVTSLAFTEAYHHASTFNRLPGWRLITGSATRKDPATGRLVGRDVAILVRRWRKNLENGVLRASLASTPIRIAPERYIVWTVDEMHGRPLAHVSVHPNAVVSSQKDWDSDRGEKYRDAMGALYDTVVRLRKTYGKSLDVVVTGDLQYRRTDDDRPGSPRDIFRRLNLNWTVTGIDWMAHSDGLRLVDTVIIPPEVNGQDHPWIEGTFEQIV